MRKTFTRLLVSVFALGTSLSVAAEDFTADGISYNITSPDEYTVEVSEGSYAGAVTIPAQVTYDSKTYSVTGIGEYAFFYANIFAIDLPNSIETIGDNAFYACPELITVTLPENLVSIGSNAFGRCFNLESITLPAALTTIAGMAFDYCSSLTKIYSFAMTPPNCTSSSFSRVNMESCTLYIPEGAKEAYNISPWNEFGEIIETDFAGTEEIASDTQVETLIYGTSGKIIIENAAAGTAVTVYTANGSIFYNGITAEANTEISAPNGIYIVKCGNQTQKVIL